MTIELNCDTKERDGAGKPRTFFLARNLAGKPVVLARDGTAIDPAIFLADTYGDYPADAKDALRLLGTVAGLATSQVEVVVLASVDRCETSTSYAVATQDDYRRATMHPHYNDLFSLFHGNHKDFSTYETWAAVEQHVRDCSGRIVGVYACIAY